MSARPHLMSLATILAVQAPTAGPTTIEQLFAQPRITISAATEHTRPYPVAYESEITRDRRTYLIVDRTTPPGRTIPDRGNTEQPIRSQFPSSPAEQTPHETPFSNGRDRHGRRFPLPPRTLGNPYAYIPDKRKAIRGY